MARQIYTTQQTGKTWKGLQALGCLGLLVGIVLVYAGATLAKDGPGEAISHIDLSHLGAIGLLAALAGLGVHALGRLGGWWFHG